MVATKEDVLKLINIYFKLEHLILNKYSKDQTDLLKISLTSGLIKIFKRMFESDQYDQPTIDLTFNNLNSIINVLKQKLDL